MLTVLKLESLLLILANYQAPDLFRETGTAPISGQGPASAW
jgi:hypothetical protein